MGDKVNEYNGSLEFNQTDVSLPGNNLLPVAVGRRLITASNQPAQVAGLFGDWDIDIPHLHTIAGGSTGNSPTNNWYGTSKSLQRCSQFSLPPALNGYSAGTASQIVDPDAWWDGYHLSVPGSGTQTLLGRYAYATPVLKPTDGGTYPILTKEHWQLSCLSTLANDSGEGFQARAPDGSRYQFDHLAKRNYPTYSSSGGAQVNAGRTEIWILPTRVTDRFGNSVTYAYDAADPWKLVSITSSDGRAITLTYVSGTHRVQTVSDGTRTWTYAYASDGTLATVTLPDASAWRFSLQALEHATPVNSYDPGCGEGNFDLSVLDPNPHTGTIVHPSGATGSFTHRLVWHGTSNAPKSANGCSGAIYYVNGVPYTNEIPLYAVSYSLTAKALSGPGVPVMTWSYAYSSPSGSWAPVGSNVVTKTVSITDPQGNLTQNTYGTQYGLTEGLLLTSAEGVVNGSALRTTNFAYATPSAGPYPAVVGLFNTAGDAMSAVWTPQSQRGVTQQATTFTQSVSGFDIYARPTGVAKSSSLGYSRSESTAYYDRTDLWLLGQIASQTVAGAQASSMSFDASTALPTASYRFGKLQASYAFNADGTLASITDPLNHATRFSNYARGLAQRIDYADGSVMTGAVNNLGLLTSVTNEAGTTWGYGYDAMGRLASKTPPGGDAVAYNPTTLSFVQVPSAEVGLDANHWRQTITTGNAVTVNYFDARWRKRLTTTYDAGNPGTTQRSQRFDYDPYNRTTFAAYPARSIGAITTSTPGTATSYDALGRPTQVQSDSELGTLTTSLQYQSGFQKRVTNPRGYATTTAYQAFDEPSEEAVVSIAAPEGLTVGIARDPFGKPLSITRSGSYGGAGVSATRSYVYDTNQLLCKTIEPETGATIQALDAANNVAWRATGLNLTATNSCDWSSVPSSSVVAYTYDARNRNTGTGFGDGSASIGRGYTADGLLASVVSNNSTWTYTYNSRRLLTQEVLSYGSTYTLGWGFDANGHISQQSYPDGAIVAYAPNALGEATQVSGYASGVSYQPNGALASYTLANGINHSQTQNVRGLPLVNSDAGALQDQYGYDADGNITAIADQLQGVSSRSMAYDGLDRLTAANAPNVWGSASYSYDPLDNLRTSVVGSRSSTHNYDASNRLASINTNGSYTGYAYDARGNITGRGTSGYYFDEANRLLASVYVEHYSYDGLGRRVAIYKDSGLNEVQVYSQAGQLLYGTYQAGSTASSTRYIYLAGKAIAETNSATGTTYLHTDALGSPVATSNTAGSVLSRTRYEAYGNAAAGTVPGDIGFTGHVNDASTGLVYMQQRYYDPAAGRFQSVDPVVTDADTGSAFNRFNYANNNPYRYTDPDGRDAWYKEPQPQAVAQLPLVTTTASRPLISSTTISGVARVAGPLTVLIPNPALRLAARIAVAGILQSEQKGADSGQATSPVISPSDVAGKTPGEIDQLATGAGLKPKGPDPQNGRGAYVDPVTGEQRVLVHGDHAHVNDAAGNRLDVNGNRVPSNSPEAHLPIKTGP